MPRCEFLEVEHRVQSLLLNSSDLQLTSLKERLEENLAQSSATIFAARLLKSSLSGESEGQPSSVSVTSQMTESDDVSTDSGGTKTPSAA